MPIPASEKVPAIERLRDAFEADATKLLLSALIILSVLPVVWLERASLLFFAVFASEWALRLVLLRHQLRTRSVSRTELVVLLLDLIATLSFLPLEGLFEVRFLRLIRLSRMLMLLSYWSPVGREVWVILAKRERRYQLLFVASMVVLLTFTAGILLYHLGPAAIDYDENGKLDHPGFWTLVWWSFRQLQDPGNLVKTPSATIAFVFSLLLTLCGIFVIAFLIGIGTSVVRELVEVGRERRLGLRNHSLIANLGPHSRMLVEELVAYYAKSFRSPRLATMGHAPARYDYMYGDALRRVRYRQGQGSSEHDLRKVDTDRARRVILLGEGEHNLADSEVVSQILSVRRVNAKCRIFAELVRPDNVRAALLAGGENTVPVLAHRLVSLLLADVLAFPGVERLYAQLLSSQGSEIYTCYFDVGHLAGTHAPAASLGPFGALCSRAHAAHGTLLLGWAEGNPMALPSHILAPTADRTLPGGRPADATKTAGLSGLFALAPNFEQLARCVREIERLPAASAPPALPLSLTLEPERHPLRKLLICGYHEGLVDLCEQLVLFCPGIAITLMVPERELARRLEHELRARSAPAPTSASRDDGLPRATFTRRELGVLDYRVSQPDGSPYRVQPTDEGSAPSEGELRLLAADWSEGQELWEERDGFRLSEIEAVLLTYTSSDTDADGRTALALLKLLHLREHHRAMLHPALRIVCEVLDSEKATLFEARFGARAAPKERDVVVLSAEQLRHAVLAQAVFVPGSDAIYSQLLGHGGPELVRLRLRPVEHDATLDFGQLLEALTKSALLPIAYELASSDGGTQLIVNPARDSPGYRFQLGDLGAVFAIGRPPAGPIEIGAPKPAPEQA